MDVGGNQKDNVIDSLAVGVTATAEDGYAAYLDVKLKLPDPDADSYVEFADIDEAWAAVIADRHIAENNWHESLDKMIEAKRVRPLERTFAWQQVEPDEG
jgi:hypothetical protein